MLTIGYLKQKHCTFVHIQRFCPINYVKTFFIQKEFQIFDSIKSDQFVIYSVFSFKIHLYNFCNFSNNKSRIETSRILLFEKKYYIYYKD